MDKSRRTLLYLALLFITPVLLSYLYFYYVDNSRNITKNNYGTLVTPPITTEHSDFTLSKSNGVLSGKILPKKWVLTYINTQQTCGENCQQSVKKLNRIRSLLNEDSRRVRVLLATNFPDKNLNILETNHSKMLFLDNALNLFNKITTSTDTIVLLDPLGNIFMRYPIENLNIKKILLDFKRLLKYSRIG